VIACIEDPGVFDTILTHLNLHTPAGQRIGDSTPVFDLIEETVEPKRGRERVSSGPNSREHCLRDPLDDGLGESGGWMLRSALLSAQGGGSPALDRLARDEVMTGLTAYALVELILLLGLDE